MAFDVSSNSPFCFTSEYKAIVKENLTVYQESLRAFVTPLIVVVVLFLNILALSIQSFCQTYLQMQTQCTLCHFKGLDEHSLCQHWGFKQVIALTLNRKSSGMSQFPHNTSTVKPL